MKIRGSLLCVLLCMALLCGCSGKTPPTQPAGPAGQMDESFCRQAGVKTGTLLRQQDWVQAGSPVGDWMAMALSLGGVEEAYDDYLKQLQAHVEQCYVQEGGLSDVKATEYHRIALTVLALGGDPTHFGKTADGTDIDLIADGTYAFGGELGKQGLNGRIWALIALDAGAFPVPADAKYTRESILSDILDAQEECGGFGLSRGSADVDITAMALQALAPYRDRCGEQIERALAYLAEMMNDSCGFVSFGAEGAESVSQVIIALCALGIDPTQEDSFCRGEQTLLTSLERFRMEDGSYVHALGDEESNMMASQQALLAQIAWQRLQESGARLYDFTV